MNQLAVDFVLSAAIAALKADTTLAALLSATPGGGSPAVPAVYDSVAPQGAPYEYLVVSDGGEVPANTAGNSFGAAVLVYLRATSRTGANARAIVSRAVTVLEAESLTVAGYDSALSELVSGGPGFAEDIRGEVIRHHPAVVRVTVHPLTLGSPA